VFFSNKYIYAQIVRAGDGHVVASASSIERAHASSRRAPAGDSSSEGESRARASTSDKRAASIVGERLGERARALAIDVVRWVRPHGARYSGKNAALMDGLQHKGVELS